MKKVINTSICIKVFNSEYNKYSEASKQFHLKEQLLSRRFNGNRKEDLEILISVPNLRGVELRFIGLDGRARYKVPWNKELQTAREIIQHERPDLLELYDKSNPAGEYHPFKVNYS